MTQHPATEFSLTTISEPAALTVRVAGELDYDTCDELVDTVVTGLAGPPAPRHVRLDFADLTWIDSMGLSALLMIHRHTRAVGAALHLDNRPDVLERVLRHTNVLGHLTAPVATPAAAGEPGPPEEGGGTGAGVS
ncbi:STAS domain-containing protein [Streptomyces sp. NPDC003388]|uniref:STAS domain-containing protein n=1 Tax=unclassified Streptomyces TaxID=2593676 RepID=UPI001169EC41|nr:STAS domain-containing protein [Streptomyces sp. 1-11]GEK01906.1 sulfate transporter [Streptomyces sp. 1-11]